MDAPNRLMDKFMNGVTLPSGMDIYKDILGPIPQSNNGFTMGATRTHLNVIDFYMGENVFMFDLEKGLIIDDTQQAPTTVVFPWVESYNTSISLNIYEYKPIIPKRVAPEGVSRLTAFRKGTRERFSTRKGIAVTAELDGLGTPKGKLHFAKQVQCVAVSVITGANFDTIWELLTCTKNVERWNNRAVDGEPTLAEILDKEKSEFICLAKDPERFEVVVTQIEGSFKRHQGRLGVILVDYTSNIDLMIKLKVRTAFYTYDDDFKLIIKEGPQSDGFYRGTPVFSISPFPDGDNQPTNLMQVPNRIVEYYHMTTSNLDKSQLLNFNTGLRDRYLPDMVSDKPERVKYSDCFENCHVYAKDKRKNAYSDNVLAFASDLFDRGIKASDYRKQAEKEKRGGNDDDDDDDDDNTKMPTNVITNDSKILFVLTDDANGDVKLAEYIGQLLPEYLDTPSIEKIVMTVMGKLGFGNELAKMEAEAIWRDGRQLLEQIDSQKYDHDYFIALLEKNLPQNTGPANEFSGSQTPSELIPDGESVLMEWKPSESGTLATPGEKTDSFPSLTVPCCMNSAAGLRELAKYANVKDHKWQKVGERANKFYGLISKIASTLKECMPDNPMLDKSKRPPWFHMDDDAVTPFFVNAVSANRVPIFLPFSDSLVKRAKIQGKSLSGLPETSPKSGSGDFPSRIVPAYFLQNSSDSRDVVTYVNEFIPEGIRKLAVPEKSDQPFVIFMNADLTYILVPVMYATSKDNMPVELQIIGSLNRTTLTAMKKIRDEKPDLYNSIMKSLIMPVWEENKTVSAAIENISRVFQTLVSTKTGPKPDGSGNAPVSALALDAYGTEKNITKLITYVRTRPKASFELSGTSFPFQELTTAHKKDAKIVQEAISRIITELTIASQNAGKELKWITFERSKLNQIMDDLDVEDDVKKAVNEELMAINTYTASYDASVKRNLDESLKKYYNTTGSVFSKDSDSLPLKGIEFSLEELNGSDWKRSPLTASRAFAISVLEHKNPLVRLGDTIINYRDIVKREFGRGLNEDVLRDSGLDTFTDMDKDGRNLLDFAFLFKHTRVVPDRSKAGDRRKKEKKSDSYTQKNGSKKRVRGNASELHEKGYSLFKNKYNADGFFFDLYNQHLEDRITDLSFNSDSLFKCIAYPLMTASMLPNSLRRMIEKDILTPMNFLLIRVIDIRTAVMILLQGGPLNGINIIGHGNWVNSVDASSKSLLCNFTVFTGSFTLRPELVQQIPALRPTAYVGGGDTTIITSLRNLFEIDANRKSILVMPIAITEEKFSPILSLTGRVPEAFRDSDLKVESHSSSEFFGSIAVLQTAEAVAEKFESADIFDSENLLPFAWQGAQWEVDPITRKIGEGILCDGHRGQRGSLPGAKAVFKGEYVYLQGVRELVDKRTR